MYIYCTYYTSCTILYYILFTIYHILYTIYDLGAHLVVLEDKAVGAGRAAEQLPPVY